MLSCRERTQRRGSAGAARTVDKFREAKVIDDVRSQDHVELTIQQRLRLASRAGRLPARGPRQLLPVAPIDGGGPRRYRRLRPVQRCDARGRGDARAVCSNQGSTSGG